MAEMIVDLLQAQTLGDEVTSATMPKTMGTTAWYPNLQCLDTAADNVVHRARREGPKRSFERHEQLSMGTPRSSVLEILKYRVTNRGHQRVILEPPLLGSFDPDDLSCPTRAISAGP